jgi:hypothetical protein
MRKQEEHMAGRIKSHYAWREEREGEPCVKSGWEVEGADHAEQSGLWRSLSSRKWKVT